MSKNLIFNLFCNSFHYGYNPEYENLSEEEKFYMDFVDECLSDNNDKFSNACTKALLLILEVSSKMGTAEELTNEEITLKKGKLLSGFNQETKDRLNLFMYSCIQTMGIYSEESIQERKKLKKKL